MQARKHERKTGEQIRSYLVHAALEALLMLRRGLLPPNALWPCSKRDKKLHFITALRLHEGRQQQFDINGMGQDGGWHQHGVLTL